MAGAAVAVSACVCVCRYADQVVHRLLAAIIGWEAVSASTLDPTAATDLTDNLNLRHTMGQYAGRASVSLHTLIFFRGREALEDAHIIKVWSRVHSVSNPAAGCRRHAPCVPC